MRTYDCSFLKRYELNTSYEHIAADVRELFTDPRLQKATLVLERTAVGLPVLDLFRNIPARIVPVPLTGRRPRAEPDGRGGWIVPKVELTSLMQVLLAGRRPEDPQSALFAVADSMGETADLLHAEWQSFTSRVQLTVSKDTSLVWRETANEDLCLAVACGCWVAEYCMRQAGDWTLRGNTQTSARTCPRRPRTCPRCPRTCRGECPGIRGRVQSADVSMGPRTCPRASADGRHHL